MNPQYSQRRADAAVYCSCRCDGPDPNARYCKCPTGFQCLALLSSINKLGSVELAGSYCVKNAYDKDSVGGDCTISTANAPPDQAPGNCGLYNGQ